MAWLLKCTNIRKSWYCAPSQVNWSSCKMLKHIYYKKIAAQMGAALTLQSLLAFSMFFSYHNIPFFHSRAELLLRFSVGTVFTHSVLLYWKSAILFLAKWMHESIQCDWENLNDLGCTTWAALPQTCRGHPVLFENPVISWIWIDGRRAAMSSSVYSLPPISQRNKTA